MSEAAPPSTAVQGLLARAVGLEQRLQRLRQGRSGPTSLWSRVTDRLVGSAPTLAERPVLSQLSRGLSRLGVHTLADAKLLRRALDAERALALSTRLTGRCERALREAERALAEVERATRLGTPVWERPRLEADVSALVRLIRLLTLLVEPAEALVPEACDARRGVEGEAQPEGDAPVFTSPRLAIAAALEARARSGAPGPQRLHLEVAHALLLDVDPGDEERAAGLQLRWRVVRAKDALAGQGGAEEVSGLVREVRELSRREPGAAYQRLWRWQQKARLDGRNVLADAAGRALEALAGPPGRWGPDASQVAQAFGFEAQTPSERGEGGGVDALSLALFGESFGRDPAQTRLLDLARGAGRFVEVERARAGMLGGVAGLEEEPDAPVHATWPSAHLELEQTGDPARARDFVIEDPRRILLDLAAGRQAVRVFVEPDPPPPPGRRSSVRIYVCDASASMQGARARFRDALLLAEFEQVLLREHRGLPVDPLYYCYFNDRPGPLRRVDDATSALRHVDRLLASTPASGRTDITLALLAAFDVIAQARGRDPELSRASVVLVTDGEDAIEPELILRARDPLRSLPISLSFVSLGQENPTLRTLARTQRAQRQRAFYVHLSDADLRWAGDAFSAPVRSLAPEQWSPERVDPAALEPYLVALEEVAAAGVVVSPPTSDAAFDVRFPEALPPVVAGGVPPISSPRVVGILEALEATVALLPLERRAAECVWLLDHLLGQQGQTLPGWQAGLARAGSEVSAALVRLRLLARRPARGRAGRAASAAVGGAILRGEVTSA